jgi:hypothetical protein
MAELCIKGTAFALARRDLVALVEAGRISEAALERRLAPRDRALLHGNPLPTSWYPVDAYERMLRVLADVEGRGDPEYLEGRGRKGFELLMRSGIYRQLERAETVVRAGAADWFERTGHVLATLPSAFFNQGSFKLSRDEGRRVFTLEATGLGELPPSVARVVAGAIESAAAALVGQGVEVTVHRAADGRVSFVGTYRA